MKAQELLDKLITGLKMEAYDVPLSMKYLLTEFAEDYDIERRNAASVIHVFLRDMLGIEDITDAGIISDSMKLQDIYDCRVCVQAIIQVHSRKLMLPLYRLSEGSYMFGGRDLFDESELTDVITKLRMINIQQNGK